jgi:hypothetical protein
MTDFAQLRTNAQQSRQAAADARARSASARERLTALRDRDAQLARRGDNPDAAAERKRLAAMVASATKELDAAQAAASRSTAVAAEQAGLFVKAIDPRQAIANLNDSIPILMMPVRIETRFRQNELLVRVYPDDCSIDAFEPVLSDSELKSAKDYWLAVYAAGGFVDQEREAWRALAGGYGSGRAEFIMTTFKPLPDPPKPQKANGGDLILTIAADAAPAAADAAAVSTYWTAAWRAAGDKAALQAARAQLVAAVGDEARADTLIATYVPSNVATKPIPDIGVSTAFVVFPGAPATTQRSWSRAATAELLPDVFVFIGLNGGVQEAFQVGAPVTAPLVVSPDPSAPETEQLRHGPEGELIFPDEMQWMVDFDRAVAAGMGLRIPLNAAQAAAGFERVLVLGVRLSSDEKQTQADLQTLITHQRFSRAGYAIVPQGTPTNNTDTATSGWARTDDVDASFAALGKATLFTETTSWLDKADGQWLAELLGISSATVQKLANSDGRDQADARAMNIALWPATLGYWMQTMMSPVFSDAAVEQTRAFVNSFVTGRGAAPAIRIGGQPYGLLPATAFSRMRWFHPPDERAAAGPNFLSRLYAALQIIDADWRAMSGGVSFAGKAGDPHQILLDIVGLNSGSVEYAQRYAESVEQLFNRLSIDGLGPLFGGLLVAGLEKNATDLLARFGVTGEAPDLLKKFFFGDQNALKGPFIDDAPLSEASPIRKYTADGLQNYIEWLSAAARQSLDALYQQKGFKDDRPPEALLYLLLRHALQLGYHDTSVRLHLAAGLLDAATARDARIDDTFINVRETKKPFESRYELLYKTAPEITGSAVATIGDYIGRSLPGIGAGSALREQLDALDRLKGASTARLERALAEHIDCCSYRPDAWLLGIVTSQLAVMRNIQEGNEGSSRQGVYIGAYAWVENLTPDKRVLAPAKIDDPDLAKEFTGASPLLSDSQNEGYIHAPSLNHAVTAAVLRNGYIANATPANPTSMAVNLTSRRVRKALAILEGIRGGQSLGALLGYQLERGLHDDHSFGVELDQFIFKLRREFPLGSNRMTSTKDDGDQLAIEAIEARNVVDGLALVNHIRSSGQRAYPFGKPRLPPATPTQAAAIDSEVDAMFDTWDAVADLAMSEGVFQAAVGNYDRVASTLDAYSKGNFPPEPLVVRTPAEGLGLTHRLAVHFETGPAAANANPRALAEPALDRWLASVLPSLHDVGCLVDYIDATNKPQTMQVLLSDLHINPSDLLQLLREDTDRSLAELDERIMILLAPVARPDGAVSIRYMEKGTAALSLFQISALVRHLRRLVTAVRPLRATDLSMTAEARRTDDADAFIAPARITLPRTTLGQLSTDLTTFDTTALSPLGDVVANRADIVSHIDDWIDAAVALLARAALFSIPQSGWGFAYDVRARIFRDVIAKAADLVTRWQGRLDDYDAAIVAYDGLPGTTADADRLAALARAERLISTKVLSPTPPTPAGYRTQLDPKRAAFAARLQGFVDITNTSRRALSGLLDDFGALLPIDDFDYPPLSIEDHRDQVVALAQDIQRVVQLMGRECARRMKDADDAMAAAGAAGTSAAQVAALTDAAKALLGKDFVVFPEFSLGGAQADEVASSYGATATLLDYLENTLAIDEPVDTWMYGVARVRERVRHLEQIVMLADSFASGAPKLTPLQFPFDPADRWLALQFSPDTALDHERLLYTAHFSQPFDKTVRQCGMLIDEWTEVIPAAGTTTGLACHYDRPNNEAAQAMLLLTPTAFRGAWQWNDVVDALNETLDLAKRRAVEPAQIDGTPYAQFVPATIMAVTMAQLTISANLAINNRLAKLVQP